MTKITKIEIFKVDVIENIGDNWMIADLGVDEDGKHYILTTNHIHASELHMFSWGPKRDGKLIAELLNEFYTEQLNAYISEKESS